MEYCIAIKNKQNPHLKCTRRAKPNCKYCGYHFKNPILFKESYKKLPKLEDVDALQLKLTLKENKISYDKDDSPRNLYNKLSNYFDLINKELKSIIWLQKKLKEKLTNIKKMCVNDIDFYTLEELEDIPPIYFIYINENDKIYGFDIRSLDMYFKNTNISKIINPYVNIKFTSISLKKIKDKLLYMYNNKKIKSIKEEILTDKQKFNQYVFDIFSTYDELGYIIQLDWFHNLSLFQLKRLYKEAEDIWNYRANITLEDKSKITNNGLAFEISPNIIMKIPMSKYRELQLILLNEFKRLSREGISLADRKLGALWMLTAFVEVSPTVSYSYSWLNQHNI